MDLKTMTLAEFLNEDESAKADTATEFELGLSTLENELGIGEKLKDLSDGYTLYRLGTEPGDVALCNNGEFVGCYFGPVLAIGGNHKGRGLSTDLILEAVKQRGPPEPRKLSIAGRAALTRAWHIANGS